MIAGADGHREELQQLHNHHGGEGQEQHAGPGHAVQDDIGHMEDIPGKANQQYHPNFSVAGLVVQGAAAGQQGGGVGGDQHCVQAAGGGGGDEPQLQGVCAARLEDEERHAGARCGLGQGDGGGGHGVQEGGGGGVHARVRLGCWE